MIVKVKDSNFDSYRSFLAEAYQYLESLDGFSFLPQDVSEEKTFTSIAQYFNYIETIKQSPRRDYFLLKLPLDEAVFEIDAETRNITIPTEFIRSSVVQRDKIAETVIFTIDRFIDNVDLCNVEKLYVQWTAPGAEGTVREWATPVELIDRESIPGKIKFGWPIDEAVTAYPGKVSFSVVFFIPHDTEAQKVRYRLNTLPATFEVKAALQPNINPGDKLNRPGSDLNAAIRNNNYPTYGSEEPKTPDFSNDPGTNLYEEGILVNNTLTLKAQAVVPDTGIISYKWYFVPENGEFRYECGIPGSFIFTPTKETDTGIQERMLKESDYNLLTDESKAYFESNGETVNTTYKFKFDTEKELTYNPIGTVNILYELAENQNNPDPRDRFYVLTGVDTWSPYTGTDDQKDLDKYEKYTTFTLPSTGKVVGEYYVEAINSIGPKSSFPPAQSESCFVRSPEDIVILGDLEDITFIEREQRYDSHNAISPDDYNNFILNKNKNDLFNYNEDDNVYSAALNNTIVKVKETTLGVDLMPTQNTTFQYKWYRSLTEGSFTEADVLSGQNNSTLTIRDVGWYKVAISANKNREIKSEESKVCRALTNPVAPTLQISESVSSAGVWSNEGEIDAYYSIDTKSGDEVKLSVNGTIQINGQNKTTDKLYSDGIKYEWRIAKKEDETVSYEILDINKHQSVLPGIKNPDFTNKAQDETFSNHPNTITYRYDGKKVYIACFAINTLNGRDTLDESVAVAFEIK